MLFLTRKAERGQDAIQLITETGERIRVVIRHVAGKKVKVGVDAPDSVKVAREETIDDAVS